MYISFYEISNNNKITRMDYEPAAKHLADKFVMAGGANIKVSKIEMEQHNTHVAWYKESTVYIPARQY